MTRPTFDDLPEVAAKKRRDDDARNWPLRKAVRYQTGVYQRDDGTIQGKFTRTHLSCGHTVDRYVSWAMRCKQCPKKGGGE